MSENINLSWSDGAVESTEREIQSSRQGSVNPGSQKYGDTRSKTPASQEDRESKDYPTEGGITTAHVKPTNYFQRYEKAFNAKLKAETEERREENRGNYPLY